jgi:hypothetical protein
MNPHKSQIYITDKPKSLQSYVCKGRESALLKQIRKQERKTDSHITT